MFNFFERKSLTCCCVPQCAVRKIVTFGGFSVEGTRGPRGVVVVAAAVCCMLCCLRNLQDQGELIKSLVHAHKQENSKSNYPFKLETFFIFHTAHNGHACVRSYWLSSFVIVGFGRNTRRQQQ